MHAFIHTRHKFYQVSALRSFVVAAVPAEREAVRAWPWLKLVPRAWRGAAMDFAGPKVYAAFTDGDGGVAGHRLIISDRCAAKRVIKAYDRFCAALSPAAHGWTAAWPPPAIPNVVWRDGGLFALMAAVFPFFLSPGTLGNPAALDLLLIGGNQTATAVAARFLARRVRHMALACPAAHFRNRLAWQILTETGLAVVTGNEIPASGWDLAIDLRNFPDVSLWENRRIMHPRPLFPRPLRCLESDIPLVADKHPAWSECHLACLIPPTRPALPTGISLASLNTASLLASEAGLAFSLCANDRTDDTDDTTPTPILTDPLRLW
jgi:hypothetical protein